MEPALIATALTIAGTIATGLWSLTHHAYRLGQTLSKLDNTLIEIKDDLEYMNSEFRQLSIRVTDLEHYLMKNTDYQIRPR